MSPVTPQSSDWRKPRGPGHPTGAASPTPIPPGAEMPTIHVVGFSGGADSQCVASLVRERYRPDEIVLLNADPGGNEHPITTEFIAWYSDHVFPVVVVQPLVSDLGSTGTRPSRSADRRSEHADDEVLTFDLLARVKGQFPSRKKQFCTEYLKLRPTKRWIDEHLFSRGHDVERWLGLRRDESQSRQSTQETWWDDYLDCVAHAPIAAWSKAQVFAHLAERGERLNPLYTMGFSRVGCAPCVNGSKEDIREWAARFPEMIAKVRAWESSVGRTFFAPILPGGRYGGIDEVVAWSRTTRGGKQLALPLVEIDAEQGTCVSRYGLCE